LQDTPLAAGHVGDTVAQLERRIYARFGERGLTKAARDLGHLVDLVQREADESRVRLRRATLTARAAIAVVFLWVLPERMERRTLLRLLHRLRSLAHVIDMHQLSKDPEQVSPSYTPTSQSVAHGLDAEQLRHYLGYCSEMLSLTAKTAALSAEHSTDGVVLETISGIETLTTELSSKIWQKISLLP
jgi:hypothetical protein